MFTVLFSDTSYNRLGVRLFSYPLYGERPREEGSRNCGREKKEYTLETMLIVDLGVAIDDAISWTELLKNLEEANAHTLSEWKESLNEVKQKAKKLLEGLENLELPNNLKTDAKELSAKARHLSRILPNNLPENSLIKELQGKLGEVKKLLSSNQ